MKFALYLFISIIISYLVGSIPFALIIGKLFYKTDVRKFGSKNLGATNVARVLGLTAGFIVLILDSMKCAFISSILYLFSFRIVGYLDYALVFYLASALFCCIGHCYPVFAKFKGGKSVATMFGFLLFTNYKIFLIFLITFIIVVLITKIVSIGSLASSFTATLASLIPFVRINYNHLNSNVSFLFLTLTLFLITILIFIRHIPNIKRLIRKEESKISFKY